MRYLIALAVAASTLAGPAPATPQSQGGHSSFTIVYRGESAGRADVTVEHTAAGWRITSTERLSTPVNLAIDTFEVRYTDDWQPQSMMFDGTLLGQRISSTMAFDTSTAKGEAIQGGKVTPLSHAVSPRTIVLPNLFHAGYEALAARLASAQPGDKFPIYLAQPSEVIATLVRITPKQLQTTGGIVNIRACYLSFANPSGPLSVEVWVDGNGRLARIGVPSQELVVVRDDVSSVMTREVQHKNDGDQSVFIPANGFTLAATITTPSAPAAGKWPAVVLVGSAGAVDREEATANVPIFGQLAGELASAGYLVVRYDRRGVGQSGGRVESATLDDYALDAGSVVTWLRKRPDVDRNRIAVFGFGEGGLAALIAAQRFKAEIAAVALAGTAGVSGRSLALLQQAHALERTSEPDASRKEKIALQTRMMDAVITGKGWEGVPAVVRKQTDTPWYKSWLTFDPAAAIAKVRQPLLILQGALDMHVFADGAPQLTRAARARPNVPASATTSAIVPNVNHLLIEARTGELDEYASLAGGVIAPAVITIVRDWLGATLRPK